VKVLYRAPTNSVQDNYDIESDTRMVEMVIFTGLQASGKSTFFRSYFAATHEHISKDRLGNKKHRQAQLIEEALQKGYPVVIDNTNPTVEVREPLIRLGRMYDAEITGYYFESQVRQCLERNRLREGKARVPDVAIYATAKKLVRPSYKEGFDKLFSVRISGDSTFEIREWKEVQD
jgi:predicted kinase